MVLCCRYDSREVRSDKIKEHRYNSSMTNMKPTAREVKVILSSIGLQFPNYIFNDKRVNGGRIKMWGFQMAIADMSRMRVMLQTMFPYLEIEVERFKGSTVVKWNNEEDGVKKY